MKTQELHGKRNTIKARINFGTITELKKRGRFLSDMQDGSNSQSSGSPTSKNFARGRGGIGPQQIFTKLKSLSPNDSALRQWNLANSAISKSKHILQIYLVRIFSNLTSAMNFNFQKLIKDPAANKI